MSDSFLKVPKGTRDLFGPEAESFTALEQVARRVFSLYQYSEVRTPIFESVELFSRSLGETSDVVEKEMFTFTDRGERDFALRPEGTAGVVRFFLENKLYVKGGIHRLFYMGPMFRAERPQAGRYRQFWQIGSEHFGDAEPTADADTLLMVGKLLDDFGARDLTFQINTLGCQTCRQAYRKELLAYLESKKNILNEESKARMHKNPLRILDSKEDGPKLKDAPVLKDFLCAECAAHYKTVLALAKTGPYPITENPKLVRGLDYYTRTVFEVVSPHLGAQNAVAAGGRYDDLVATLGGPGTPGIGFALGMDRVVSLLVDQKTTMTTPARLAVVIALNDAAIKPSFELANQLRKTGVAIPPITPQKKLKNILSQAVDIGANWAILIGEDELAQGYVTIKDLSQREQKTIALKDVSSYFQNHK